MLSAGDVIGQHSSQLLFVETFSICHRNILMSRSSRTGTTNQTLWTRRRSGSQCGRIVSHSKNSTKSNWLSKKKKRKSTKSIILQFSSHHFVVFFFLYLSTVLRFLNQLQPLTWRAGDKGKPGRRSRLTSERSDPSVWSKVTAAGSRPRLLWPTTVDSHPHCYCYFDCSTEPTTATTLYFFLEK